MSETKNLNEDSIMTLLDEIKQRFELKAPVYYKPPQLEDSEYERIKVFLLWIQSKHPGETLKIRPKTSSLFENNNGKLTAKDIYNEIFHDIRKTVEENKPDYENSVTCSLKFDITMDKSLTTEYLKFQGDSKFILEVCNQEKSDFQYGTLKIAKAPVLYMLYVYVDLALVPVD